MKIFAISKEIHIPHADEMRKFKIFEKGKKGREDYDNLSIFVSLVVGRLI